MSEFSDKLEAIHEIGRRRASDGWKKATEGLNTRDLDRVWGYRSIQYNSVFTAAAVELVRRRLEEAAILYRHQQYEKSADLFYSALADAMLIEEPESET